MPKLKGRRSGKVRTVLEERRVAGRWAYRLDSIGICASVLCMLHCLALPLLLAALPALTARLGQHHAFHWIVLALALPTGALALVGGWRRHRAAAPMMVGGLGLALLTAGVAIPLQELVETGLTVAGSLFLAGAHLANWRHRALRCTVGGGCALECRPMRSIDKRA
ncbi:MerC domain-containing protein [Sphingomonas sp. TDK1]|uniref:MerC domain-containing protein n=1 Tax=Sphingomonas sp. TDK1 TaxID=453247 RepID=UPI0007D98981|nr:MerC domain-containing protein [Sphingomonas sp. TDK1]OAN65922.1 hypothetical protein A7X12_14365 [Sphingomonas sp. TDK1]